MERSLADDLYTALLDDNSASGTQQTSQCRANNVKRNCSNTSINVQSQVSSYSNESPRKRNSSRSHKKEESLSQFENSRQAQKRQKSVTVFEREKSNSRHSKDNLHFAQDQHLQSQDTEIHKRAFREKKKIPEVDSTPFMQNTASHTQHDGKRDVNPSGSKFDGKRDIYPGGSRFDEGWQKVPKRMQGKNQKEKLDKWSKHDNKKDGLHFSKTNNMAVQSSDMQAEQDKPYADGLKQSPHQGGRNRNSCKQTGQQVPFPEEDKDLSHQGTQRKYCLGFKHLEKLAEDDPCDVVIVLANRRSGFETLVKEKLRPDLLILVLKVLSKLCKAGFEENKVSILSHACHHEFLNQISEHIALIPLESNKRRKESVGSFLDDLMVFLETVMNLLPSKAVDGFEKIFMITEITLKIVEEHQSCSFEEGLKIKFDLLKTQYKTCIENQEIKLQNKNTNNYAFESPEDDFREINLFPSPEDILAEGPGFVRPNIIDGAYDSVYHYLDVQFRLLREDFVSPLREGILEFINLSYRKKVKKVNSVKIYRKVFFLNPKVVKDRLGLIVCFDPDKHLKKVNWEHSKRFMFGSLLLFSRDNFTNIIFATVMDRDITELKKGNVIVQLSEETDMLSDLFTNEFVMAESQVYFEPYHRVLKALQNMKHSNFPMEKYIIHAQVSSCPPKYMCSEGGALFDVDGHAVSILNFDSWPGPQALKLDDSQYNAFKSALTKEFAVVQGPPGTGKTFLGLKVATVLLKNAPVWYHSERPILVLCYTNHALDQFLEGLLPVTDKLVRIGGQSRSTELDKFNLKQRRMNYRNKRSVFDLAKDIRYRMSDIMTSIKRIEIDLQKIAGNEGIISLSVLKEMGIRDQHMNCFESHDPNVTEKLFVDWLEYGMYEDVPYEQVEQHGNQNQQNAHGDEQHEEAIADEIEDVHHNLFDDYVTDWELEINYQGSRVTFALDLRKLEEEIEWIELQTEYLKTESHEDPNLVNRIEIQEQMSYDLKMKVNYIKRQLCQEQVPSMRVVEHLLQQGNLWGLLANERWMLYRHWVARLREILFREFHRLEASLRTEARMYEEVQQLRDLEVLQDSLVVGMTTTGAARLQTLLQALKPKIVIVEEAAEVMECHIVVSLTQHCEHLILIGDHKQLRPSPAVFRLARDFNFDISLFERMLKNRIHCEVLKVQHRMRPEIAELIVPTIYPVLENDNSVLQFQKIHGMLKSMFFITHNHPEEQIEETSSHRNIHEGDFLIALCRYLVLQGYSPTRITILATYSGQLFYLRKVRNQYSLLNNVKITVVDNFQGEENDIILLSLVRSNKEAMIGFLKAENRVCVALSRAKMGFYIIGNMDNLTMSSKIWPKIKSTLKNQDALGTYLTLRCQIHPSVFTRVCCAADFNNSPEGGCTQRCEALLECGHECKSVCHIRNREHVDITCFEPCDRVPENCELQHKCRKLCWENCGDCKTLLQKTLPCGHSLNLYCYIDPETHKCPVKVETVLPNCGHKVQKPCYAVPEMFPCSTPCEDRLQCGHSCTLKCHVKNDPDHLEYQCNKPCARKNAGCKEDHNCVKQCCEECGDCKLLVKRELPHCNHSARMQCSKDPETYICMRKCNEILPCEHPCPNVCSAKCGNCQVKVTKLIRSCGHRLKVKCCEDPNPKLCMEPCEKTLPCGHKCTTVCSAVCTKKCQELIPSRVRSVCGHLVDIPCFLQREALNPDSEELLSRCQMPCDSLLKCEHRCAGKCGECMQGRIHQHCNQKCGRTLICGHSCNVPCAESCPPCNRKCQYRCKHSKCSRLCGQPCIKCKEPCDWACIHQRCTKLCHELCDRKPCNELCDKLLPCKHQCIGFCGEKCPPLCRICDEKEVTEVFFGTEDEPDARFVYLEDCKHTFESQGLEQWMSQTDEEIQLKQCPKCKTAITKTQRYMNRIKEIYKDICRVKSKCFGKIKEIEASRDELKLKLLLVERRSPSCIHDSSEFQTLYEKLSQELQPVLNKRLNILSITETGTLKIQVEILSQLVECTSKTYKDLDLESRNKIVHHLNMLFKVVKNRKRKISSQETDDINLEIQRFHRLCQLYKLKSEPVFKSNIDNQKVKEAYEKAYKIAHLIEKFSETQDAKLKIALQDLAKAMKSAVMITDAERKAVVQAMHFQTGHWFKCPNGHIYAIGECGGAMEVGRCIECGAPVGGSQHRLLESNSFTGEMDGAVRPAWPPR